MKSIERIAAIIIMITIGIIAIPQDASATDAEICSISKDIFFCSAGIAGIGDIQLESSIIPGEISEIYSGITTISKDIRTHAHNDEIIHPMPIKIADGIAIKANDII